MTRFAVGGGEVARVLLLPSASPVSGTATGVGMRRDGIGVASAAEEVFLGTSAVVDRCLGATGEAVDLRPEAAGGDSVCADERDVARGGVEGPARDEGFCGEAPLVASVEESREPEGVAGGLVEAGRDLNTDNRQQMISLNLHSSRTVTAFGISRILT